MFFANSSASNPYRWVGDGLHVLAIIVLLVKLYVKRNSCGISAKTQLLLALTYTARYADLWGGLQWVSYYNTYMKIFYITVSWSLFILTVYAFKISHNREHDSFRIEALVLPVTFLAFTVNYDTTWLEIAWTWSIYMESVALVPQLYMIWKAKSTESYVIIYLMCMAFYRGSYIANWVYRYNTSGYYDIISITGGLIETFVGLVGLVCVISQSLSYMSPTSPSFSPCLSGRKHYFGGADSVFVIPLISNELKSKAQSDVGILTGNGKSNTTSAAKSHPPV